MKFYRYMSKDELVALLTWNNIEGDGCKGRHTTSSGKCFLAEKIRFVFPDGEVGEMNPLDAFEFLYGIVSPECLVEFEANTTLNKGTGVYANPYGHGNIEVEEYSLPSYNSKTMIPLRYADGFDLFDTSNMQWHDIKTKGRN